MELVSVKHIGNVELLSKIQQTRLVGFGGVRPYLHADLRIAPAVETRCLAPAQNYVLKPGIEKILELREALLKLEEIDIFALDEGLLIRTAQAPDEVIPVIPPIVETSHEPDGRTVALVNDGLHRTFTARSLDVPISVIMVDRVPAEYPYYAFALPGGWNDVEVLESLPSGYQKKAYRHPEDHRALFRNFNEVLPGVQKRRTTPPGADLGSGGLPPERKETYVVSRSGIP